MKPSAFGVSLVISTLAWCAAAQESATAPSEQDNTPAEEAPVTPTPSPIDAVRLKDGSLYRGTIAAKSPERVEIVLITGKVQSFEMSEVDYAGPAEAMPIAPQPKAEASAEPPADAPVDASVKLQSNPSGLTFHRLIRTSEEDDEKEDEDPEERFEQICTAPCSTTLPPGTHVLAVSQEGDHPVGARRIAIPPGDSTLTADYKFTSHSDRRTAAMLIFIGGLAAGGAVLFHGQSVFADKPKQALVEAGVGLGIGVAGFAVALLVSAPDETDVKMTSNRAFTAPPARHARGVTFSATF